jgi:xylulokinase
MAVSKTYLIGVDVGSSFTKASLFDVEGQAIADARQDTHPHQPRAGVAEYDGPPLMAAAVAAIKEVIETANVPSNQIAAICLDGMISGAMGIDARGDATTPYTTTLDMRFAPQLNHVMDRFHDLIRAQTGSGQPTIGPKMMWIRDEFPEIYRNTAKFVTITGYMVCQLAELAADKAMIDYTYLWASGLSDTHNYAWSDELCWVMDLSPEKLPQIVKPFDIVGRVSQKAASATGLQVGTPIVAGAGDQSAAFIGAALTRPNRTGDAAGTFPIISICTDKFRPDRQNKLAEIIPSAIPGLWHPVSLIIGGGLTHHWFQETFAHQDQEEAKAHGQEKTVYDVLDGKAGKLPPGSDRLVFIPHLGGRACPTRTNYRGLWFGLTWTHRREHFYRAVLEAVAYDHALAFESLKAASPSFEAGEVFVYGGGARSRLWNQIKADVMGLPYVSLEREDLSALGASILSGYALGIYDDIPTIAERFATRAARFEPDPQAHELYHHYTQFYGLLLDRVDPAYDALASLPAAQV